jgi:hypothetical protein
MNSALTWVKTGSAERRLAWSKGLGVEVGGHGVVSHAGSAATRLLADRAGLTVALSRALARRGFVPLHDRGRVLTDLAGRLGHDCMAGPAGCDGAALARISKARAKARRHVWDLIEARHGSIPPAKVAGRDLGGVTVIRLDATIVVAHSDKQQARDLGTRAATPQPITLPSWTRRSRRSPRSTAAGCCSPATTPT